jgi:serine/threonine protein kinase
MIGKTVSHYRIMSTIGSGGMSVVYKAEDTKLGRLVALKFLLERYCRDSGSLEQFHQEARTASALNHPGICTIHDIDLHGSRPFIVMEYLEGETLRDTLKKRGLTMSQAIQCGIHIADAVSQAHAIGIVHRDISPANLFVTRDGRVKLLDFGIARQLTSQRRRHSPCPKLRAPRATLTGTIHYMSPEQAQGYETDARSDVFSVGVVLYEMLTGRRPFAAENMIEIINRVIESAPLPLRRIAPNVPEAIEALVNRCLDKRPDERFRNATELRDALKAAAIDPVVDAETSLRFSVEHKAAHAETIPDTTFRTPLTRYQKMGS